jgi:hypothetical protein
MREHSRSRVRRCARPGPPPSDTTSLSGVDENLPTIEAVGSRALAASNGKSNQPKDQKDHCDDPEKVQGETEAEEQQHQQESQN